MINFLFIFLASLLSTSVVSYVYCVFTSTRFILNFRNKLFIFLGSFIMSILKYFDLSILSLVLYFIYYPILLYNSECITKKDCFLTLLIIWIYCSILDLLFLIIMSMFSKIFYIDVFDEVYVLVSTLFVNACFMALSNNLKIKKFTNKLVKYFPGLNYINILLMLFVILIFIIGFSILVSTKYLKLEILLIVVLILSLLSFVLIFSNILIRYESKLFLKNVKENNEFYIELNNRNRIFKHNIINKILAIKSIANSKSMLLIDDLINEISSDINKEVHFKPIPYGLIGIIYQKISDCKFEIDLNVINNIEEDLFELLSPRKYNILIEKIGIILDNAIEACKLCDEKIINILVYQNENFVIVEVTNKFSANIDLDKLGNLNYSSKGKRRGLGLFSLFRVSGVDVKISIINNLFNVKLAIKYN